MFACYEVRNRYSALIHLKKIFEQISASQEVLFAPQKSFIMANV